MTNTDRQNEIVHYATEEGDAAAEAEYNITHETLRRYKRAYQQALGAEAEQPAFDKPTDRVLREIAERYTVDELKAIARGGLTQPKNNTIDASWFTGNTMVFGVITDTHIGSKDFRRDWFDGALDQFARNDVEFICHVGDITEGMSGRPGHIYELEHLGYTQQKNAAIPLMAQLVEIAPTYTVSGNHDRWHIKANGADIVQDICDETGVEFLGHDTGDIMIGGIKITLWHGEDGSSYAHSYRIQKVIESMAGGTKPNILLTGHVHKAYYFFDRNIHAIGAGCIQQQTQWMRAKRLPAHPGFWIIEADINDGCSVVRFNPQFYPFYH